MKTFSMMGHSFRAAAVLEGVLIDPELPAGFDTTPNEARGPAHRVFADLPFIRATRDFVPEFVRHWPAGVRFDVRCLDGGAWDRSTVWGMFATLPEALACAKEGPAWRTAMPRAEISVGKATVESMIRAYRAAAADMEERLHAPSQAWPDGFHSKEDADIIAEAGMEAAAKILLAEGRK